MNPFHDAHETSLSQLSHHDWMILSHRHARGIDWNVQKIGSRWQAMTGNFPLFKTKTAAGEAVDNLVLAESRHRAKLQWATEHA